MGEKVYERPARGPPSWPEGKECFMWSARFRLLSFERLQNWLVVGCFVLSIVALTNGPLFEAGSKRGNFEASVGLGGQKGARKLAPHGPFFGSSELREAFSSLQEETKSGQEEVRTHIDQQLASLDTVLSHRVHKLEATLAALQTSLQAPTPPNLYTGNNIMMCWNTYFEMYFFLDSRDGSITPHLCRGVQWEIDLTEVVMKLVSPGQKVVNVGSAVGWYTAALMTAVGPAGRVMSVEANPRLAELQERSFQVKGWSGLGQVVVVNKAVSQFDDRELLVEDDMSWSLANRVIEEGSPTSKDTRQVSSIRLDTLLEDQAWSGADFISIDVEGSEAAVWDSMPALLAQEKPLAILMKVNFIKHKHNGIDSQAFLESMRQHFPTLSFIDQEKGQVTETTAEALLKQTDDVLLYLVK